MQYLSAVIIILALVPAIIQDFKHRAISWAILPLLFIGGLALTYQSISLGEILKNAITNIIIILFYLLFLSLYFSIKERKLTNIINRYLGIGDVLFFVSISVLFSPLNFIVFITGSLVLILIASLVALKLKSRKEFTIPLAGALSILLIPMVLQSILVKAIPLSNDNILIAFLFNYA